MQNFLTIIELNKILFGALFLVLLLPLIFCSCSPGKFKPGDFVTLRGSETVWIVESVSNLGGRVKILRFTEDGGVQRENFESCDMLKKI